jgi:hypothetical protein
MQLQAAEGGASRAANTGKVTLAFCMLCLLGVLAVVLFPSNTGPFTASYGPATAFSSTKKFQQLELSIMVAALQVDTAYTFSVHLDVSTGLEAVDFLQPVHLSQSRLPLLC